MLQLSHDDKLKLTEIFEQSGKRIQDRKGRNINGIPFWEIKKILEKTKFLKIRRFLLKIGYTSVYPTFRNDKQVLVNISLYKHGFVRYRNLETLSWDFILEEYTSIYQIDYSKFFSGVISLFSEKVNALIEYQTVIPNIMWCLGNLLNRTRLYIVRNINSNFEKVHSYFSNAAWSCLVLISDRFLPHTTTLPKNCRVLLLKDVISEGVKIDSWTENSSTVKSRVQFDEAEEKLLIDGKSEWEIKGIGRQNAIKFMIAEYEKGNKLLKAKRILEASRPKGSCGGSIRMQSLFKDTDWEDYIYSPKRGYYSFLIDEEETSC